MTDHDRRHDALLRSGASLAGSVRHVVRKAKADAKRNLPPITHTSLVPALSVVRPVLADLSASVRRIVNERIPDMIDRAWAWFKGLFDPVVKTLVSAQLLQTVGGWFGRLADISGTVVNRIRQGVWGPDQPDPLAVFDRIEQGAEGVARDAAVYVGTGVVWGIVDVPGVVGYTVMSQSDNRVRPEHWRRHRTTYYRNPVGKQLSYEVLPRPPFESPFDNYRRAWGCRCYLVPVFDRRKLVV